MPAELKDDFLVANKVEVVSFRFGTLFELVRLGNETQSSNFLGVRFPRHDIKRSDQDERGDTRRQQYLQITVFLIKEAVERLGIEGKKCKYQIEFGKMHSHLYYSLNTVFFS